MLLRVTRRQSECKVRKSHSCNRGTLHAPTGAVFLASQDCDMLEPMYVRCAQCGYDNSPEFRFCGMCGGPLPHPPKEASQPERDVLLSPTPVPLSSTRPTQAPAPLPVSASALGGGEKVHGPSFLGLSDDPREDSSYEDDEEPRRGRAGLITVVVLLIAAAGVLGWQWRHQGFPFNRITTSSNPPAPAAVPVPDASQNPETPGADKSAAGSVDQPGTAPESGTPADSSAKLGEGQTQETAAASPSPDQAAPADKAVSAEASPAASVPPKSRVKKPNPAKAPAAAPAVETASLAPAPDADLELAGERYLYGTGLPQNCTRAESSLGTAAAHGNSKAETVLGTMYATGHCVGRDLPAAYRWFARALHQDPQNSRISDDLQVLWRQMTPQEKQLATASGK
jgi:hypothetical protein